MAAPQARDWHELDRLIDGACDQTLSAGESAALSDWLASDRAAMDHYIASMRIHGRLAWHLMPGKRLPHVDLQRYAEAELRSFDNAGDGSGRVLPATTLPLGLLNNSIHGALGYLASGWPVAYLVATVIIGIGLFIGSLMPASRPSHLGRPPSPPSVADTQSKMKLVGRITGMVDCQWAKAGSGVRGQGPGIGNRPSLIPNLQSSVALGDKFTLASGLIEVTYDTGAKVILQGPATYEVESPSGGFLAIGKLTARVEKKVASGQWPVASESEIGNLTSEISNPQSPIPNPTLATGHWPLFTIKTPTAIVTDLGTEFGVEVSKEGNTISRVFRGSVRLQVTSVDGKADGIAQVLHENQSARVAKHVNQIILVQSSDKPTDFIRRIPKLSMKTLDLVDVVAGGDGFSGRRNRGIDPTNGRVLDRLPNWGADYLAGDGKYHPVQGLPFVDGVFIPDGSHGPVPIASTGLACGEFPKTSNETAHAVWAGGAVPAMVPSYPAPRTQLGGIDYASAGHGLLFLHANKGITFDLAAIRRANPERKLVRFCAAAGNTENSVDKGEAVNADVWVLVDGQVRFRRREINQYTGVFSIAIPIGENDRFLTLAATDGGNGISWDWILFGDPRLELVSAK